MESIYNNLSTLIENAKKSLNKPYKVETIEAKLEELSKINKEAEEIISSTSYTQEQRNENLNKFKELKQQYRDILDSHKDKRSEAIKQEQLSQAQLDQGNTQTENLHITKNYNNSTNMDTKDIIEFMKIIPIFNGDRNTLDNFISTVNMIDNTLTENKKKGFFEFIYTTRLDKKTQNKVKQSGIPTNTEQILNKLKTIFKPKKTANTILNELTKLTQNSHSITKFGEYIETLIGELTELQTLDIGEQHRTTITAINYNIGFNTFKNGLNDRNIIQTIEASRVKTLQEAITLAEEVKSDNKTQQILYQSTQRNNYRNRNNSNNYQNNPKNNNNNNNNQNYNRDNNNNKEKHNMNRNKQSNNNRYNDNKNRNDYNRNNYRRNNQGYNQNIHCVNENNYSTDNPENFSDPEVVEQNYPPEGQEE